MRRRVGRLAAAAVAALLAAGAVTGCGGDEPPVRGAAAEVPTAAPVEEPASEEPVDAPADPPSEAPPAVQAMGGRPSPSASAKSRPKPTRTSTAPLARPKPPTETRVPPAPKPPASGCKPSYRGTKASQSQVKKALTDAAARTYWPTSAPDIRIPSALMKATAWQESGWQSNIYACDTGVGLMQVMPATAEWMNQRFEQSYDIDDYRDNAYLGGTYLAWLTKYIGDMYFESDYRLDASLCTAELNSCLLNAVISAYNFGHAAVAREGKPLAIPNPQYVYNVRELMTSCECLAF